MYSSDLIELRNALGKVSSLADSANINQTLSHVLIELENSKLTLTGSDGQVEISTECSVEPGKKTEGVVQESFAVRGRKLSQFLGNLACKELSFKLDDQQFRISSSSSRSRVGLVVLSAEEYPRMEVSSTSDLDLQIEQTRLCKVLRRLQSAVSTMSHRVNLAGILFDFKDSKLRLVATDGHRMAVDVLTEISKAPEASDFILPRRAVQELLRVMASDSSKPVTVSATLQQDSARTATFTLPGTRLTAQLIPESFPDYERVIPKKDENPNMIIFSRSAMFDAVNLVSSVHDKTGDVVELQTAEGSETLEIIGKGNNGNDVAKEELQISSKHPELQSKINSAYLRDLLTSFEGEESISLAFKDGKEKLLFTPADDKKSDFKYVVMPVR